MSELQSSPKPGPWAEELQQPPAPSLPAPPSPAQKGCSCAMAPGQGGALRCCQSEGVLQVKAMACFAIPLGSPNTTCSVVAFSRHPRCEFRRICQIKMKGGADLHSNSLGFMYLKYSDLDEEMDGLHAAAEYISCAPLPALQMYPKSSNFPPSSLLIRL